MGFKQRDIKKCASCGNGLAHKGNPLPLFWRMKLERFMLDPRAIQRQHGLEQVLGGGTGGGALAMIMGPNEDLAQPLGGPIEVLVCEACVNRVMPGVHVVMALTADGQ